MRAERLRRTKDIEIVRAEGELRAYRLFSSRSRGNGLASVRIAVASPRSVGTAVRRNRARRRIREAIRAALRERAAAPGTDLFVLARGAAVDAPSDALRAAVRAQLDAALGTA
ncbi:MAG: ribonuclease P protein component [Chloroflexota bacterium]|nr:ribonuclease P protein component [Chloroflexota bacterium]MDE3194360.1 ribonuclease P protein component [Chloroflexota bacterium]